MYLNVRRLNMVKALFFLLGHGISYVELTLILGIKHVPHFGKERFL